MAAAAGAAGAAGAAADQRLRDQVHGARALRGDGRIAGVLMSVFVCGCAPSGGAVGRGQIAFYFSDANLRQDGFMAKLLAENGCAYCCFYQEKEKRRQRERERERGGVMTNVFYLFIYSFLFPGSHSVRGVAQV